MDILNRFKEGSSWAALAAVVALFAPDLISGELWEYITNAGVGASALAAFLLKDKGGDAA